MRFKLISCKVFLREMEAAAARSPHEVDVEFLPQGYHNLPNVEMRSLVQAAIDAVPETYDAILLGYGLCNNGLSELVARHTRLVLPRAHDCITLFLGSKERYKKYFFDKPGTYFKTSGWIESAEPGEDLMQLDVQQRLGMEQTLEEYIEQYGEDNGKFLYEQLGHTAHNYGRYAFIEMGVEPDDRFELRTREDAEKREWDFEKIPGDMGLIHDLMNGNWREDAFLVVEPGQRIRTTMDDDIVAAEDGGQGAEVRDQKSED